MLPIYACARWPVFVLIASYHFAGFCPGFVLLRSLVVSKMCANNQAAVLVSSSSKKRFRVSDDGSIGRGFVFCSKHSASSLSTPSCCASAALVSSGPTVLMVFAPPHLGSMAKIGKKVKDASLRLVNTCASPAASSRAPSRDVSAVSSQVLIFQDTAPSLPSHIPVIALNDSTIVHDTLSCITTVAFSSAGALVSTSVGSGAIQAPSSAALIPSEDDWGSVHYCNLFPKEFPPFWMSNRGMPVFSSEGKAPDACRSCDVLPMASLALCDESSEPFLRLANRLRFPKVETGLVNFDSDVLHRYLLSSQIQSLILARAAFVKGCDIHQRKSEELLLAQISDLKADLAAKDNLITDTENRSCEFCDSAKLLSSEVVDLKAKVYPLKRRYQIWNRNLLF